MTLCLQRTLQKKRCVDSNKLPCSYTYADDNASLPRLQTQAQIKTLVDGVVAEVAKLTRMQPPTLPPYLWQFISADIYTRASSFLVAASSASEKAEAAYWHGKALNAQEPYRCELRHHQQPLLAHTVQSMQL